MKRQKIMTDYSQFIGLRKLHGSGAFKLNAWFEDCDYDSKVQKIERETKHRNSETWESENKILVV